MRSLAVFGAIGSVALSACATTPPTPPSYIVDPGQPAPAQARFYADCIAASVAAYSFDREASTIRFHCDGAPARAFYEGLAAWSTVHNSEVIAEGRTWRFTEKMIQNPSGLDYCWRAPGTDPQLSYGCTIVLNAGAFLGQD